MSTLKVNKLENTNTSNGGISIDTSGHVSIDGQQLPSAGPLSNRNLIINGAMQIDQRSAGAVGTTTGDFYISCDRWRTEYAAANKFTLQQTSTAPAGFGKSLKVAYQATANPGSGDAYLLKQVIEGNNIAQLNCGTANAKTITLSFYIQANVSGDYAVALSNGANNRSYVTSVTVSSTTDWEYKTITIPGDTTGTWASDNTAGLSVKFNLGSGTNYETATTNAWQSGDFLRPSGVVQLVQNSGLNVYITGVQLEVGETATPFEHRSYGDELARCQRYYGKIRLCNQEWIYNEGNAADTKWHWTNIPFTMRTNPSVDISDLATGGSISGLSGTISSISTQLPGDTPGRISSRITMSTATGTARNVYHTDSFNGDYIAVSAEL